MRFVGNYAPRGLSPQTDGMPVIPMKKHAPFGTCLIILLYILPTLALSKSGSRVKAHILFSADLSAPLLI